jgi:hypothetical protein
MPSIICHCGQRLGLGEIPNPIEWLTISDIAFDDLQGQVDAELLYQQMQTLLRCPRCHRLWAFWDGLDRPATVYAQESS